METVSLCTQACLEHVVFCLALISTEIIGMSYHAYLELALGSLRLIFLLLIWNLSLFVF